MPSGGEGEREGGGGRREFGACRASPMHGVPHRVSQSDAWGRERGGCTTCQGWPSPACPTSVPPPSSSLISPPLPLLLSCVSSSLTSPPPLPLPQQVITECLAEPEVSQTEHAPLLSQLLSCVATIIDIAREACASVSHLLFTILLRIAASRHVKVEQVEEEMLRLARVQGLESTAELFVAHAGGILEEIKVRETDYTAEWVCVAVGNVVNLVGVCKNFLPQHFP